jgi:peptidoglycan/LPS O-acetylase OafA/YrhL
VTGWLFDLGFVVIACPLMIAGAMRLKLRAALANFAGACSFPLYALHFPLLMRLRNYGLSFWQSGLIALVASALVTALEMQLRAQWHKVGGWRARVVGGDIRLRRALLKRHS